MRIRYSMKRMQNKEILKNPSHYFPDLNAPLSPILLCKLTTKPISTNRCSFQSTCLVPTWKKTQIIFLFCLPLVHPIDIWGDDIQYHLIIHCINNCISSLLLKPKENKKYRKTWFLHLIPEIIRIWPAEERDIATVKINEISTDIFQGI